MSSARPAIRAYMISLLGVRRIQLGAGFASKFPHPWLVWEPGVWQPAMGAGAPTRISGALDINARPSQGDALSYELVERRSLRIGRATDCEIVLNDATVSREHLILEPTADGWAAKVAAGAHAQLGDAPLGSQPLALHSGQTLKLGDVTLTFLSPEGFAARLDRAIEEARKP